MNVTVVDASALAAVVFDEPGADSIAARLEQVTLVAPRLLAFEMINICVTKLRRHPERRDGFLRAFALQGGLEIETVDVDPAGTLALAEQYGLSGYDASYLWLAQQLNAELVTLDRQLARAAVALRAG